MWKGCLTVLEKTKQLNYSCNIITIFVSFLLTGTQKEDCLNKVTNSGLVQLFHSIEPNAGDCGC